MIRTCNILALLPNTGNYELVAKNKFGQMATSAWIDVLCKPEIVGLKDQTCVPYETVAFEVQVFANPKPKVTWSRGNENLSNNENCEVIADVDADKYRLVFQSANRSDGGKYTITAVNDQGTTKMDFNLNVHCKYCGFKCYYVILLYIILAEKPTFIESPEEQQIHDYAVGATKVLVHGIPQPKIEWLKDGKPIPIPSKADINSPYTIETKVVDADQISSVLEVKPFRPEHEGLVS